MIALILSMMVIQICLIIISKNKYMAAFNGFFLAINVVSLIVQLIELM